MVACYQDDLYGRNGGEEIIDLLKVFHQRLPVKQVSADE